MTKQPTNASPAHAGRAYDMAKRGESSRSTKRRIAEAALELFKARDYDDVSLSEIARAAGRPTLARNFKRAAELVNVPQAFIMEVYELLRPGRAKSKEQLLAAARVLRTEHAAPAMAGFVEEAAEAYEQRGLFTFRF